MILFRRNVDLPQVSLARILSIPLLYKKPISNHMLRKDNDTTERGSAMFLLTMADSSFDGTVDNNPFIFENGSKARLLMNVNEHAKYYKSLTLFFLFLFFSARDTCGRSRCNVNHDFASLYLWCFVDDFKCKVCESKLKSDTFSFPLGE